MIWDKKKIEKTLLSLNEKIQSKKSEDFIDDLIYDYHILLSVLKLIDKSSYEYYKKLAPELDFSVFMKKFTAFRKNSFENLIKNRDLLFKLTFLSEKYRYARTKVFIKRFMKEELYLEFVREFLKDFDQNLYSAFLSLADGNIHFAFADEDLENARGICYYLISEKKAFIVTDFKRRTAFETLPHEIAHAFEFSLLHDFNFNIQWHLSFFCEAYPTFVGLAFLDYVIDKFPDDEYYNVFLEQKRNFFDSVKLASEYYLSHIGNITSFDMDLNCIECSNKKQISKSSMSRYVSDFLAIYMLHLYKTDKAKLEDFLHQYQTFAGHNDEEIWNLLNFEDVKEAFLKEASRFNQEVCLSRKRIKKNNTFN